MFQVPGMYILPGFWGLYHPRSTHYREAETSIHFPKLLGEFSGIDLIWGHA